MFTAASMRENRDWIFSLRRSVWQLSVLFKKKICGQISWACNLASFCNIDIWVRKEFIDRKPIRLAILLSSKKQEEFISGFTVKIKCKYTRRLKQMGAIDYGKVKIGRSIKSLPSMLYWWRTLFHKFQRERELRLSVTGGIACDRLDYYSADLVVKLRGSAYFSLHPYLDIIMLLTLGGMKFKICVI